MKLWCWQSAAISLTAQCAIRLTAHFAIATSNLLFSLLATAQIVPDATLKVNSIVTPNGNTFTIDGGSRAGGNLFHSFQEFSLPTGGKAFFNNGVDVQNIFSRVTGSNISNIDGLIRANGGANLFLINPNGIIFGPNARLNIGGSFFGTTASSIRFADGVEFSATNTTATPLLTVSVPMGLQMGKNPGAIANQSQTGAVGLQVPNGQTLALVGGGISFPGGRLTAVDGNIELGSVGADSLVSLIPQSAGWTLNYQGVKNFQDIQLSQGALIDTTGNIGGSIQLLGRRISLTEQSNIQSQTLAANRGRGIDVQASEALEVNNSAIYTTVPENELGTSGDIQIKTPYLRLSTGESAIATSGMGNTGNLTVDSQIVELIGASDGSGSIFLDTSSQGEGQAGNITINAESLLGTYRIFADTAAYANGNGGNLILNLQRLQLLNGAQIGSGTFGAGNGGTVIVNASESVELNGTRISRNSGEIASSGIFNSAEPDSSGNGGDLIINTGRLSVLNGGKVATNLLGSGNAGNIIIRAREIEVIEPVVDSTGVVSGLIASVDKTGTGQGGNLDIQTDSLHLFNGGQISAATDGAGNGGNIQIQAREINISGWSKDDQLPSSISSRSSTNFRAGTVNLITERLRVENRGNITVTNTGTGDAGNLNIAASNIWLQNQASLQAEVNGGSQGNINLNVRDALILRCRSLIDTNATGASTGGNITINASSLVGLQNSDIVANAIEGNGGNISINTQAIFGLQYRPATTLGSDITASSKFGLSGTVAITNPEVDTRSFLVQLPQNLLDLSEQISAGCADKGNTFTVAGRGGLPEDPSSGILGRAIWWDDRDLSADGNTAALPKGKLTQFKPVETIQEATGWMVNAQGQVELVAQKPQETPWYNVPSCQNLIPR